MVKEALTVKPKAILRCGLTSIKTHILTHVVLLVAVHRTVKEALTVKQRAILKM